jgi:two-component system sensor histidine kinase CpxA
MPLRANDGSDLRGTLFVGFSSLRNPLFAQTWGWFGLVGFAALISVLFWLPLVRGLTRSIHQMMHATATIADGKFDVAIGSTKRTDELGLLANSITRMASQLEAFVKGQKRFLGDAAHELRSPLGRMRIASEILERRTDEATGRYVDDIEDDVELMSRLTDQLLTFAKAEFRPDSISLVPTKVADVVQRAVNVEAGQADIRVDVNPEIQALAEPDYLFRSVSNLVRNSLKYAAAEGPIEISARAEDQNVLITVADSGPGVPEDALEKIFEPFFRLDTSRQRKTGGTGLGLAIVRTCIEACHGSIECRNRKPSGLVVTLRLARG